MVNQKTHNNSLAKLKKDINRYLKDYHLSSPILLLLIVDFWPILHFRLNEFSTINQSIFRQPLKIVLTLIKPIVDGFSNAKILHGAKIEGGFLLHHGAGVVIAQEAQIGENCTAYSGSCVVNKSNGKNQGAAIIGKNVRLMVGCKIIGNVTIGNNATIGANAVVLHDVPNHCTAVGNPARIIKSPSNKENEEL